MKCWKCKNEELQNEEDVSLHHIRGHDIGYEVIPLCKHHHDLVEGVCNKCIRQSECFETLFARCWQFDDTIPPVYFQQKNWSIIMPENLEIKCPSCHNKKLHRISFWKRCALPLEAYWKCDKCGKVSYLSTDDWNVVDIPTVGVDKLKHIINYLNYDINMIEKEGQDSDPSSQHQS